MKNILICGTAKSGKSYLSKMINEKKLYNHIPLDYFTSSFKHNFPELEISSNVIINKKTSEKLSLFLSRVINIIDNINTDEFYILDSAHLYPDDIMKYIDTKKWDVYFLGYPNISVDEKFLQLRKYVNDGWVIEKEDYELKNIINELIKISKEIMMQCRKYNIKFIDTSDFDKLMKFKLEDDLHGYNI